MLEMADAAPSADTFIPVEKPASEASGDSASMAETIRAALEQVKDAPDDEAPAPKPTAEPEAPKDEKAKADKGADDANGDGDDAKAKPKAVEGDAPSEQKADDADKEKVEKVEAQADDDKGRHKIKPPERLLPDAKEQWLNVPRSVQRDVDNIVRDYEQQIETHKQETERYESIKPFDELARSNGRDLRDSLLKLNQIENLLKVNPFAGLNAILAEIGPRKADGQPISLLDIAQHINQRGPEEYQRIVQQGVQQQQIAQRDTETERLRHENEALKSQQVANEIEARVIAPFKAQHPRFDELQGDIAFFLKSGRIPEGLSHLDKLEAAYAMAERLNPSPGSSRDQSDALDRSDRVEPDSSGRKSIRSSPGSVSPEDDGVDASDQKAVIRRALRQAIRA